MKYGRGNVARGTCVHDIDIKEKISHVMLIDTDSGEVVRAHYPFRTNYTGDAIETETIRFRSIYPITDGGIRPVTFHCYGRL